jgi:hypothetical protein
MHQVSDLVICVNDKRMDEDFLLLPPPLTKGKKYIIYDTQEDLVDVGLQTFNGEVWWVFGKRFVNPADITEKDSILESLITEKELELN